MKTAPIKPTVISLVNPRGGVGRTTLAIAMARCLTGIHRKSVLLLDLDPSRRASVQLKSFDITGGSSLMRRIAVGSDASFAFSSMAPLAMSRYDFVLIDTPATVGSSFWNALSLSTHYLIPALPEAAFIPEITRLVKMISRFSKRTSHGIKPLGVVATHVREPRAVAAFRQAMASKEEVAGQQILPVFEHYVRHTSALSEDRPSPVDVRGMVGECLQRLSSNTSSPPPFLPL